MEGTPQLLTDVKFSQHRRGYDPDEVDNFLEHVSAAVAQLQDKLRQATERAEMADSQLAEARRLQAEAEAAARAAGAGDGTPGPALDADEELKKVLLLAQRAADQAVAEANTTATKTVADARAKALALLAEAEAERDRMMEKARKKADATVEQRAQELRDQVAALEAAKVDLEADVATLDGHLADETARLRATLETITDAIDDPRGLRLAETPPLNDTSVPVFERMDEPIEPSGPGASSGSAVIDIQEGPIDTDDIAALGIDTGEPAGHDIDAGVVADSAGAGEGDDAATADDDRFSGGIDGLDLAIDLTQGEGGGAAPGADGLDEGLPTELFTPTRDEAPAPDPSLGEPDAAADAAMRAFFEQDLDEDPTSSTPRPRFGRRR